jgi:hypothetical protein
LNLLSIGVVLGASTSIDDNGNFKSPKELQIAGAGAEGALLE